MRTNESILRHLGGQALEAGKALDALGLTLLRADLEARNPILWIAPPPHNAPIHAMTKRVIRRKEGRTERLMATFWHGAQVQWEIRA